jgi:hypothetical protein
MRWKIFKPFQLFLFVVSEVSTGRRCLSLALFYPLSGISPEITPRPSARKKNFTVKKPEKRRLNPVGPTSFYFQDSLIADTHNRQGGGQES